MHLQGGIRKIMSVIAVIVASIGASAQDRVDSVTVEKFHIFYPVNETELHIEYMDNIQNLRIIQENFRRSPKIDSIVIYSYASPEGPFKLNTRLAKERGERAREYLLEHLPPERNFPDSLIIINHTAENWEGLLEMVQNEYPYQDKDDVLNLLTRADLSNDDRKVLLKKINDGRPWEYIRTNILPRLRYATWVAEWVHVPPMPAVFPVTENLTASEYQLPYKSKTIEEQRKIILALKSNLLYDALSLANFSIEVPFGGDKFSMLYYHQFPWWTWGQADNEYCTRFLSIGGEARWWFKSKNTLQGHFLGAYAESGKYDFEYQRKICYQGEFYSAGLSYGYAMPIGDRFNLEFSVSAGYASVPYRGYIPSEDYEILWRDPNKVGRLHYFGLTKAQISLVLPISVKTQKGGAR